MGDDISFDLTLPQRRAAIASAKELRPLLISLGEKGAMEQVKKIIEANDLVLGVFPDGRERDGYRLLLIKGATSLERAIRKGIPDRLKLVGIPCLDASQAEAARQVLGDGELSSH